MPDVLNYEDRRGREPVDEYVVGLLRTGQRTAAATLARHVALLEEHGANLGMPHARLIDRRSRLWELRPGSHRVAYAEHGDHIVLLHAWRKRSQKLDTRELQQARSRLADWMERH
ncbi:MAG: hypothetical protein F4X76_00280 [Chloroflexi bacterium]|nr:hypothetical protein [Chloroflexota bacterium]